MNVTRLVCDRKHTIMRWNWSFCQICLTTRVGTLEPNKLVFTPFLISLFQRRRKPNEYDICTKFQPMYMHTSHAYSIHSENCFFCYCLNLVLFVAKMTTLVIQKIIGVTRNNNSIEYNFRIGATCKNSTESSIFSSWWAGNINGTDTTFFIDYFSSNTYQRMREFNSIAACRIINWENDRIIAFHVWVYAAYQLFSFVSITL